MTIRKRFIIYFSAIFFIVGMVSFYLIKTSYSLKKYLELSLPLAVQEI